MGRVAPAWNSPGVGGSGYLSCIFLTMNTTETQPKIFELNQIVSAGINGHPRFFRVVRLTAKTAWFQELVGQLIEHDGYGQAGYKLPSEIAYGDVFSKRIKSYDNGNQYCFQKYEGFYTPWDFKALRYDSYD